MLFAFSFTPSAAGTPVHIWLRALTPVARCLTGVGHESCSSFWLVIAPGRPSQTHGLALLMMRPHCRPSCSGPTVWDFRAFVGITFAGTSASDLRFMGTHATPR